MSLSAESEMLLRRFSLGKALYFAPVASKERALLDTMQPHGYISLPLYFGKNRRFFIGGAVYTLYYCRPHLHLCLPCVREGGGGAQALRRKGCPSACRREVVQHSLTLFLLMRQAQEKELRRKRSAENVSPSADGDKGYAPLTALAFYKRRAENFQQGAR